MAAGNHDDAVVAVMKEVKKFLKNSKKDFTFSEKRSIIKEGWNEDDHPRDENGRFAGGGSDEDGYEENGKTYYKERRKDRNGEYFSRPTLKLPKK